MYLLLTNISTFLGGLGVSGELWLFGHLRPDFVKKKFSGHIGIFKKKQREFKSLICGKRREIMRNAIYKMS
jgi:hypothetical protein